MAQWFKTLAAFPECPGSVPSVTPVPGHVPSSAPEGTRHTHRQNTNTLKIKINLLKIVNASTVYQVKVDKAELYFTSVFVHN